MPNGGSKNLNSHLYRVKYEPTFLLARIPHMPPDEREELYRELRDNSYFAKYWPSHTRQVMDSIVQVRAQQHEWRKREELRDAVINFLNGNAGLAGSIERAAERIADAIENAGGHISESGREVVSMLENMRMDVSDSELPLLISEVREELARRAE